MVVWSSAKAKHRVMAVTTCELIWLKQLLKELSYCKEQSIKLEYDS